MLLLLQPQNTNLSCSVFSLSIVTLSKYRKRKPSQLILRKTKMDSCQNGIKPHTRMGWSLIQKCSWVLTLLSKYASAKLTPTSVKIQMSHIYYQNSWQKANSNMHTEHTGIYWHSIAYILPARIIPRILRYMQLIVTSRQLLFFLRQSIFLRQPIPATLNLTVTIRGKKKK